MSETVYGLMAEFDSPGAVLHAAEKVRGAGYRRWDVFTPFPIHGLDQVMGYKNSLVGWVSLAMGGGAFLSVVGLLWYCNAFDYPLIVGGKPMFSPPMTFVPAYILMIMGAALGALIGMLAINQLPRLHHPFAVGDGVENFAIGQLHDALVVQIRHRRHDADFLGDPVAVAQPSVTRRAVDVKPSAPALEQRLVDRQRVGFHKIGRAGYPARVHRGIFKRVHFAGDGLQRLAAGHGARGRHLRTEAIGKKMVGLLRPQFRLAIHAREQLVRIHFDGRLAGNPPRQAEDADRRRADRRANQSQR